MKLQTHVILSNNLYTAIRYTLLGKKKTSTFADLRDYEKVSRRHRKEKGKRKRERERRVVSKLQGVHGKVS